MEILTFLLLVLVTLILFWVHRIADQNDSRRAKRNYMKYPVYTPEDIRYIEEQARAETLQYRALWDHMLELLKEEEKSMKSDKDKTYSEQVRNMGKEAMLGNIRSERLWEEYRFMIESNAAVLNSKKTIREAENEYVDLLMEREFETDAAEKRYKEWAKRVLKNN